MFGKKKEPKVKEPSPREIMIDQIANKIEQLAPGQSLIYRLSDFYWEHFAAFFIVEVNPGYPERGKKYIVSTDNIASGKPAGQKRRHFDSNKPKEIASSIVDRKGELFG